MEWLYFVWAAVFGSLGYFVLRIVTVIWWKPFQVKRCFQSQGVSGPPYRLLNGNVADMVRMNTQAKSTPMPWSHDIVPRVLPQYHHWEKTYGKDFVYWFGSKPRLNIPHPELIKEIMSNKFGHYENISSSPLARQLVGQGLVGLRGGKWMRHRRIINPAFHLDFLKGMVPTIVVSTANMLEEWSKLFLAGAEEVEVLKEFCNLTADVISRTAFGNSYAEAKHIFNLQDQQTVLTAELMHSVYVPGFRFLPTRKNRQRWKLEKEIRKCVRQVIEARERTADIEKSGNYGADLLGVMMSSKNKQVGDKLQDLRMATEEIIDECKTFYFAGHETTSILLTWTMILLGMHQDWQERGRKEVLEVCGKNVDPDVDSVNHLKIGIRYFKRREKSGYFTLGSYQDCFTWITVNQEVGMILNEVLRLYPPAVLLHRQAYKPLKLGRLSIPAGTQLLLPILAIHHDQALWGSDANEFNPARFSEGIAKAVKHPLAFMPFGFGPKICVGQNFALLEAKVVLAMILQRFSFVTSPSYAHAPVMVLTMRPQHGAQVILHMN